MYKLFAIDPEVLNSYENIRYLLEKFGYDKGALIPQVPKNWHALVFHGCEKSSLSDKEFSLITELLTESKELCCVKMGSLNYKNTLSWLDNIKSEFIREKVSHVISNTDSINYGIIDFFNKDNRSILKKLFDNCRDIEIKRTAIEIAEVSKYLIKKEKEIIFVDPYFYLAKESRTDSSLVRINRYINVIKAFVDLVGSQKNKPKIIINCVYEEFEGDNDISLTEEYKNILQIYINNDWRFQFNRWSKNESSIDYHARYLLTSKGGLRYDRGFVQPEDLSEREKFTDVSCLDMGKVQKICHLYNHDNEAMVLKERINIS